jgi:hypothetical protein
MFELNKRLINFLGKMVCHKGQSSEFKVVIKISVALIPA